MLKEFKGKPTIYKVIMIVSFLGVVMQTLVLAYINLTQMKYHMGFDASSYYLKALEMYKQGTIFVTNWSEQTTLYLDSAVPLAALLMNVFHNIFISYGLANLIVDLCIFSVIWKIFEKLNIEYMIRLIVFNILLCPYIVADFNNVNDVFYFSSLLTSGAWYGVKLMISVLFMYIFIDLSEKKQFVLKDWILICITIALCFVSGISSGYYLAVTILIPAFLCGVMEVCVENEWRKLISPKMIFTYINVVVIIIGKYIAEHVLLFVSKDSEEMFVSLSGFWNNLGSIFVGYLGLLNALPNGTSQKALELNGLIYLCGFGIAIVGIIGLVTYIIRTIRKNDTEYNNFIFPMVVLINITMFALLFTTYGGDVFERRYWTIPFYCIAICTALWINNLDKKKIFTELGCVVLVAITLIYTMYSDKKYISTKEDIGTYDEVVTQTDSLGVDLVYFYGDEYGVIARNMRVYDSSKIYKQLIIDENGTKYTPHWGDYWYYDYASDHPGKVALVSNWSAIEKLPEDIKASLVWIADTSMGQVYYAETNTLGL